MIRTVQALNKTRGNTLAGRAEVAETIWSRFWGLMGRRELPPGHGLLISPCTSIHMFFMRFPIDVVFVDREHTVRKIVHSIKPWRTALGGGGRKALELPAGTALENGVQVGDQLEFAET